MSKKSLTANEVSLIQHFAWNLSTWQATYGDEASKIIIDYNQDEGLLVETNKPSKKRRQSRLEADVTAWVNNHIATLESYDKVVDKLALEFVDGGFSVLLTEKPKPQESDQETAERASE